MADTNPANFANLPKEKVQEIASMGGKASHGTNGHKKDSSDESDKENAVGRREDGTFLPGSEAAKEAGHKAGLHAAGEKTDEELNHEGRREDGTFKPGSEAAKIVGQLIQLRLCLAWKLEADCAFAFNKAGHKGGLAAAEAKANGS